MADNPAQTVGHVLVPVSPEFIGEVLMPGEHHYKMDSSLPADARVAGGNWDAYRRIFLVHFASSEFEPVPLGQLLPEVLIELERQYSTIIALTCPHCGSRDEYPQSPDRQTYLHFCTDCELPFGIYLQKDGPPLRYKAEPAPQKGQNSWDYSKGPRP